MRTRSAAGAGSAASASALVPRSGPTTTCSCATEPTAEISKPSPMYPLTAGSALGTIPSHSWGGVKVRTREPPGPGSHAAPPQPGFDAQGPPRRVGDDDRVPVGRSHDALLIDVGGARRAGDAFDRGDHVVQFRVNLVRGGERSCFEVEESRDPHQISLPSWRTNSSSARSETSFAEPTKVTFTLAKRTLRLTRHTAGVSASGSGPAGRSGVSWSKPPPASDQSASSQLNSSQ